MLNFFCRKINVEAATPTFIIEPDFLHPGGIRREHKYGLNKALNIAKVDKKP